MVLFFRIATLFILTQLWVFSGISFASEFDGYYLGVQLGAEQLNSDNKGPRASGTSKTDDIGGLGFSGGFFGGYGRTFNQFYLGGELEVDFSTSDPTSTRSPGGRDFSFHKEYTYGLSGRLGYVLEDKILLYGRGGLVQTRFKTDLTTDIGATFDSGNNETGSRFGLGAEVALSPNSFFRLDYTVTNYNSYSVNWTDSTLSGTDAFDNDENLFRFGYIYRFSANPNQVEQDSPNSSLLSGLYVGIQGGGTGLGSILLGPRSGGTLKDDDLANIGLSGGLFAGYGKSFGKLYFGLEVEGNLSDAEWVSQREPADRLTRVRKDYDLAGSLIGGYLINKSFLVYGRVGAVIGRFNTFLRLGDGRTFNQSDSPVGYRVGLGTDMAVTKNLFFRLDYIFSQYNDYNVDFSSPGQIMSNNRRIDNFENNEMTFRVGLGYRFGSEYEKSILPTLFYKDPKRGVKAGSFRILPSLLVSGTYDDNIFATQQLEEEDFITTISPLVTVKSEWTKHKLNLSSGADIEVYTQDSNQSIENYWLEGDGRLELTDNTNLFGGGQVKVDHVDRQDVNEAFGIEPTRFRDNRGHLGVFHKWEKASVRVGGTFQQLDFDNVTSLAGVINNNDRDRKLYTVGSRVGFTAAKNLELFVQGSYDGRRYDTILDDFGFQRKSDGLRVATGLSFKWKQLTQAEFFGGYIYQEYHDPNLTDVSTYDFGARFTWKLSQATSLKFYLDRSVEETIIFGASSYIDTLARISFLHKLSKDLELNTALLYFNSNFSGITREDNSVHASLFVKYFIHKNIYIGPAYQYSVRDSNIPNQDYQRNQITFQAGLDY